jgi:hypothetical protein
VATLIDRIAGEVEKGLSTEARARMDRVQEARAFYDFDGERYMPGLNDAETAADYIRRPYRESGLCRGITDLLCEHLYAPGPARAWDRPGADEVLQRVYDDNHVNSLMQRADQLATLGDCAAIQVDAARGRFGERPIRLRLWAGDEFAVWEEPDDRLTPAAVCTRDMYDEQTRYRLWTDRELRTFLTDKGSGTAGGRAATQVSSEPNPYGVLPFAFVHYTLPVNRFWEPGLGDFLTQAEIRINDRLSRLDQSIARHLNPIPILIDAPDGFQFILGQPNLFLRLNSRAQAPGTSGDFGGPATRPEASYLEAHIDIEGAWSDLRGYYDLVLETSRVPRSAWRMEQTGIASGIALIVEQAPLLTRARRRQMAFNIYEDELARAILACAAGYYRRPALAAEARAGRLAVTWPMPNIPIQTDDWLNLQLMREQAGLTSKIMITMETYGCGRDRAIAILEQVREDRELEETIMPPPALPPPPPPGGPADEGGDEGGDDEGDDDGGEPAAAAAGGNGKAV